MKQQSVTCEHCRVRDLPTVPPAGTFHRDDHLVEWQTQRVCDRTLHRARCLRRREHLHTIVLHRDCYVTLTPTRRCERPADGDKMKNITDEIIRWEARNDKATETAIDGHWSTHQLRIVSPCKSDIGRRGSEHPRQCAAPPQSPRQRRRGASGCHILIRVKFQCSGIIVDDSIWIDGSPSATKGPENGCKDFRGPLAFATETWCLSQTVINGKQACVSEITKQHTHLPARVLPWAIACSMVTQGVVTPVYETSTVRAARSACWRESARTSPSG